MNIQASRTHTATPSEPWLADSSTTWHSTNDPRVFKHIREPEVIYEVVYGDEVVWRGQLHVADSVAPEEQSSSLRNQWHEISNTFWLP